MERIPQICAFIALLTIIISSVGLFGLILFFTQRKMKEVGIRKVLGFSFGSLYMTLSSGFIKLLLDFCCGCMAGCLLCL